MVDNINTFFDNERNDLKTFKEIKNDLNSLFFDVEKQKVPQSTKKLLEKHIIENLREGLKILAKDYLYPLKYLTTYNTVFLFEKQANKIFPGDILKLEGEKLFILRKNKKIIIGKIIKKEIKKEEAKKEKIINKKIRYKLDNNKKNTDSNLKSQSLENINKDKEKDLKILTFDEFIKNCKDSTINEFYIKLKNNENISDELYEKFVKKIKILEVGEKNMGLSLFDDLIIQNYIFRIYEEFYNKNKNNNKYFADFEKFGFIEKFNKEIIDTFNRVYENHKILNFSKEDLLKIVEGDYIKAIVFIMIYSNEQSHSDGFISRKFVKDNLYSIDKKIGTNFIHSIGEWNIRLGAFNNEELKRFFKLDTNKFSDILDNESIKLFNELKEKFEKNNKLTKEEREKLLLNSLLTTFLVKSMLNLKEKRINRLLKRTFNIDLNKKQLNNQELYFYTNLLSNGYHLGTAGAIRLELFTDVSLKIVESFNGFDVTSMKTNDIYHDWEKFNYQNLIRRKYKGFIKKLFGKVNFYKRNLEIQKETIRLIVDKVKNDKTLYGYLNTFFESNGEKFNLEEIENNIKNLSKRNISKNIILMVNGLSFFKNINPIKFTADDYNNTNVEKAMLVGNYGPSAWRHINK